MAGGSKHLDGPRRDELASYDILDTPAESEFDDIVKVASDVCGMPVSLISLLDGDRQWFKAETGFGRSETPLSQSICAYAVQQDDVFEIEDLTQDARTSANPLVTGGPGVRFYAGAPLRTPNGVALGALCVLDTKPNKLTPAQAFVLRTLANQVVTTLELRRSLRLRKESDRRNKAILESAVDYAIVSLDLEGMVTSWSPGAERILGWNEDEMRGKPAHVFFTEEDVATGIPEQEMASALLHGRGTDERWHLRKDGSLFWANGEMMPLRDEDGRHEGFLKILRDRTTQRDAAAKEQADAAFMRGVLSSSADCIKVLDPGARLTFMNEGGLAVMEADDFNQVRGCDWTGFWHGQARIDAQAAFWAALSGGTGHFQAPADTLKGTPKWWDVQVTPIRGADGQPERLLVVSRDITRQRASEQLILDSEKRWRGLFEGMHEGFFSGEIIRDHQGRPFDYRFVEINPAFAAQSGLPVETVGRTVREVIPGIPDWVIETYARVVDTGLSEIFDITVPELGRVFEVRAYRETERRFAAMFIDVSERKRTDARRAALAELGDRLRNTNDPAEIARMASEILGRTLGLSHAGYGAVDHDAETILVDQGWSAPGLPGIGGVHGFRDYGSYIESLKNGHVVVIDDVGGDPRTASDAGALAAIHVRSLLNLPLMEHGRFVALLYALKDVPYAWTPEEISFANNIADRTRAALARIEAEERQRTLNLELSHRMKNMLAMVQSIATQTMRTATDVDAAREVLAGRLIALSKSHDLLLGGAVGSAPIETLIESALQTHRDNPGRFILAGPTFTVGSKAAMSLSLILHELATNAAKYGALSTAKGKVAVEWTLRENGGEPHCALRWSEQDGPVVTAPTRTGFGSRLIGRGLAGNFGGEVDLSYPATGVVCTIDAPLRGLQAEDTPAAGH
ncbi:PAS domain-containing protein [Methylobacterium sp. WL30]|nr:PAS domain-containing protein [Methylobacterium sp. WL18]TXN41734.1 PAS domain-containing protein [Methylobacterium sp. WL93]TXN49124.1 PAS domain-containing protein [Methylobacterium sp. WL119]TXN67805.1 PAS domain-containing protein [Methylobacterium sp. WL30]TXN76008.1 PAS domain-containing protein [Methylobacterium sp. WL18]